MTAPASPEQIAEWMEGKTYPFGKSLREHMSTYVDNIPKVIAEGNDAVEDTMDRVKDMDDDDKHAKTMLEAALKLNYINQTMQAVWSDLTQLLQFVDWEHSFHEMGRPQEEMVPGAQSLALALVYREHIEEYGIGMKLLNGQTVSASTVLSRDEVIRTISVLQQGLHMMDQQQ